MLRRANQFDDVETYDEFQEQYGEKRMAQKITPEVFELIKNLISAYDDGDRDLMKDIAKQIKSMIQEG
jgi:hypothetical protein